MGHYNTVIFDLDGTLLNTLEDLTDSVNAVLNRHGMATHSIDAIRGFVGNGIDILMERAIPSGRNNESYHEILAEFKEYYSRHCNDKTKPYDGVLEMLSQLKEHGYRMGIVSNKADFAVKTLNNLYFSDYVDVAIGAAEGRKKKPAPDAVMAALSELKSSIEESVYIGDSEVDVATAANCGMDCICVEWGFRDRKELVLAGAKDIVLTPSEILLKYLL